MKTDINWDRVKELMAKEKFEESPDGDGCERCVYLGTVFSLFPSGKFYTPWACNNVTEEEANKDEEYREALESEAEELGYYVTSGEGDPCDILVVERQES